MGVWRKVINFHSAKMINKNVIKGKEILILTELTLYFKNLQVIA